MKIIKNILTTLVIALVLPFATNGNMGGVACALPIDYRTIDPLDTLDEEDLAAMRDTMMLTRINRAKDSGTINALDYVLKDNYSPKHHSFDNKWYDHLYVGASFGLQQVKPQSNVYRFRSFTELNFLVGKQLDRYNSLRLSVGGGWGYQRDKNAWLRRAQLRLDYMYNLSTHFAGYNPSRRLEASLLVGVGGNFSSMSNSGSFAAPEGHLGLQLKCFTGPLGTFNIEPYVGISGDNIDVSATRNWHGYDIFYGVNFNYSFYLVDNLSKEARLEILQSRMADERMVNKNTIERWRTPWFIEFSQGLAMSESGDISFTETLGNQSSLSVGRWLSPVIGFRVSAVTRSTKWRSVDVEATRQTKAYHVNNNSHYLSGRLEALINPFGFSRNFRWDAPWGAYLAFGGEMGTLTRYMGGKKRLRAMSESYDISAHLWYALRNDLQVFMEPRYSHNVYTVPYSNVNMRQMNGSDNFSIDFGLTMLVRSNKYADIKVMDHTQNFTYRDIRGFRVGASAGMPIFQRRFDYGEMGHRWSLMSFVEYRFNELHSVRAQAEFLNTREEKKVFGPPARLIIPSLNYEVSLTNLCSGRYVNSRIELEAFAGVAAGIVYRPVANENSVLMGIDGGLKLSAYIWKGISAFITPTVYFLHNKQKIANLNTESVAGFRLYQTLNVGLQYKIGKLRINPTFMKRFNIRQDKSWAKRQMKAERAFAEKLAKKNEIRADKFRKKQAELNKKRKK